MDAIWNCELPIRVKMVAGINAAKGNAAKRNLEPLISVKRLTGKRLTCFELSASLFPVSRIRIFFYCPRSEESSQVESDCITLVRKSYDLATALGSMKLVRCPLFLTT